MTDWRRLLLFVDGIVAPVAVFVCLYLAAIFALVRHLPRLAPIQLTACVAAIVATGVTLLITRRSASWLRIDHRSISRDVFAGLVLPIVLLGIADALIAATSARGRTFAGTVSAAELFIILLPAAIHEELLVRGIVFDRLARINRLAAIGVTALVFALLHLNNTGLTLVAVANLTLGGVLLGLARAVRNTIWLPIVLHWSWNVVSGPLLGYEVSGFRMRASLFTEHDPGPAIITGGAFGLEASIWTTVVTLAGIAVLARRIDWRDPQAVALRSGA